MIIFKSILPTFKLSVVFRGSWDSSVNYWLEPKIKFSLLKSVKCSVVQRPIYRSYKIHPSEPWRHLWAILYIEFWFDDQKTTLKHSQLMLTVLSWIWNCIWKKIDIEVFTRFKQEIFKYLQCWQNEIYLQCVFLNRHPKFSYFLGCYSEKVEFAKFLMILGTLFCFELYRKGWG